MGGPDRSILISISEELIGERVLVRPSKIGDGAAIYEAVIESRAELRPWMPWEAKTLAPEDSEKVVRRAISKWILREDLMLSFWNRESGKYLGGSGLHRINWEVPSFEIGYWVRSSETGKGYVTEAVKLIRDMAFGDLGANRVYIKMNSTNLRSVAVAERAQFIHEGTLRCDDRDCFGNLRDTEVFALTRDDYLALK